MNYDFPCLRVSQFARLANCETHKLHNTSHFSFLARLITRETLTDIFARSESHLPQNSREKNCETKLAVNPTHRVLETFENNKCFSEGIIDSGHKYAEGY